MVNGPGQNAAASACARLSNSASLPAANTSRTWTISGACVHWDALGPPTRVLSTTPYILHLLHQPRLALQVAQRNWEVQKEPADARILLEAAKAAGDDKAAQAVRDFMQRWGWHDRRLEALL